MPSIAGRTNQLGIIVQVMVTKSGEIQDAAANTRSPDIHSFNALLDTGASVTCLSPAAIRTAGLQPVGITEILGAGGAHQANNYIADLFLGFGNEGIGFPNMRICELNVEDGHPFQVLLGMDIISKGCFTLSFDGHFTFSV